MTPEEIGRLAEAARRAGVHELELSGPGTSLRLRIEPEGGAEWAPAPPPPTQPQAAERAVRSPGVGVFHHRHPLTGEGPSEPGQRVAAEQIVGFLDVGACLRPVTAPEAGVLGAPLHEDGTLVGYGTRLYALT